MGFVSQGSTRWPSWRAKVAEYTKADRGKNAPLTRGPPPKFAVMPGPSRTAADRDHGHRHEDGAGLFLRAKNPPPKEGPQGPSWKSAPRNFVR